MEKKVILIEQADLDIRYLESLNLINAISGRKVTQSSQLNGNNAGDKVVLWYEHFRKLLGNSPEMTDKNEEISPVFENLHIKDDIFSLDHSDNLIYQYMPYYNIEKYVLNIVRTDKCMECCGFNNVYEKYYNVHNNGCTLYEVIK